MSHSKKLHEAKELKELFVMTKIFRRASLNVQHSTLKQMGSTTSVEELLYQSD